MDWELLILLTVFAGCFFGIGYVQGSKKRINVNASQEPVDDDMENQNWDTYKWKVATPEEMEQYEKEIEEAFGPNVKKEPFNTETVEDYLGRTK